MFRCESDVGACSKRASPLELDFKSEKLKPAWHAANLISRKMEASQGGPWFNRQKLGHHRLFIIMADSSKIQYVTHHMMHDVME